VTATSPVVRDDIIAQLSQHRALRHAPPSEHAWLAAHGSRVVYEAGDIVTRKGEQAQHMIILFSGHVVIRADRGAGAHKIFEWKGGDVGGAMPYSRGASPPRDACAEERTEVLSVDKDTFSELTRECPVATAALVHIMIDRARQFTSGDLRDEKLVSLGKLAAGLAHELNNPASAVVRSSKLLIEGLSSAEEASRILAGAGLSTAQYAAIDRARAMCDEARGNAPSTPIERADREDELTDWLADHRATQEYAIPLADTGITPGALDLLAQTVSGDALEAALGWISSCVLVKSLAGEIEHAGERIHDLVGAVKGFSYMDHAPAAEPLDIRRGVADTLTMLNSKARAKGITIAVEIADDVPRVHAVGAELNQVWMNLLDNAIDAVGKNGHVTVRAARERERVVVRIVDDGPGVPPEIQGRIFDPFFTTKGVGEGTGLGLDIVRRLLQRHDGDISLESVPGHTEFQVRLQAER
jgi:signal transduction histidine kinase